MDQNFKLYFLNGSFCSPKFQDVYLSAYQHWREMWRMTFRELDGADNLVSDNFTRQDEILALFDQDKCIAMVCNRLIDPALQSHQEDSYFQTWPRDIFDQIQLYNKKVVIGNQITIDPNYRKLQEGTPFKFVLMWLYHRRLLETADLALGAVREDKKLDQLFTKFGAEILAAHVIQHNVPVSLIAVWKNKIALMHEDLPMEWLNQVYQNAQIDPILNMDGKETIYEAPERSLKSA